MKKIYLSSFLLLLSVVSFAATITSTTTGGDWSTGSTWVGGVAPATTDDAVIDNGATVTIGANTTIAQLTVNNGGTLSISATFTLTISNGLTLNGTIINAGTDISLTGGATVGATGVFNHNRNGGAVITATWATGSTLLISGAVSGQPTNLTQSFSNFTWNCPSQNTAISFSGALTTVTGTLSVLSTGSSNLRLATNANTFTANFANISLSGSSNLFLIGSNSAGSGSANITVSGNITLAGTSILDINGTSSSAGASGGTILTVNGDFSVPSGTTLRRFAANSTTINFFKTSGTQTFTGGGTLGSASVSLLSNFRIGDGTTTNTLVLGSAIHLGNNGFTVSVRNNATLNFGTFDINGASTSTFSAETGSSLITAHLSGINIAGVASGSVRTVNRTYNTGVNYTFNGAAAQATGNAIGANPINNFTITNSAGVTIGTSCTVNGTLTVSSGTLTTGGNLTLGSSASGTARVANVGGAISGNIIVQRFIPAGNRRFRFLSHPFTTAQNINVLGTSISYTGGTGTADGFSHTTTTNNPSVFTFTTANADGGSPTDAGWSPVTLANSGTPWGVGQGIRILVRGTFGQGLDGNAYTPSAATISMTGTINTGTVNIPIVTGGSGVTAGFNLVGNPYPSPVNIGAIVKASGLIGTKTVYVRNPTSSSYLTRNVGTGGGNDGNYMLNSASAFFVKADVGGNLVFTEADKGTAESGDVVFSTDDNKKTPAVELEAYINGEVYDNYIVKFSNKYSKGTDKNEDAVKMRNDELNMYSKTTDGLQVAVDARNFTEQKEIPLGITLNRGKQTVTLKTVQNFLAKDMELVLWDKLTNTKTTLTKDAEYTLELDKDNDATVGENRLVLLLNSKFADISDPVATATTFKAKIIGSNLIGNNDVRLQIDNPLKAATSIRMVNLAGQVIQAVQGSKAEQQQVRLTGAQLQAGKYFIEVICGGEKQVLSVMKN